MAMAKKKLTLKDIKEIFLAILAVGITVFLEVMVTRWGIQTNSPGVILLDTILNGGAETFLLFATVLVLLEFREEVADLCKAYPKRMIQLAGITLGVLLVIALFPLSGRYGDLQVNGKEPSKIRYECYLLADAITGETETYTVRPNDFRLDTYSYTTKSRSHRSHHTANYAEYADFRAYLYRNAMRDYVTLCREQEIDLTVESCKRSGVIQTVNGIAVYDTEGFRLAAAELRQAAEEQIEIEVAEKEAEEDKELELFRAFYNSEGKCYEDIATALAQADVPNTYEIVYLSTHYFEPGEVVFFDSPGGTVYVARDQDGEEMIEVPSLPANGTFAEVTQILDEAGMKWTFDCFGCYSAHPEELDHSRDTLKTVHCLPGTPVPREYAFWFSVDHVE